MTRPNRLNRFATIAILPLMAVVIVLASKAVQSARRPVETPHEGLLVVANLRAESLSLLDLANGATRTLALPGPPHEMAVAGGRLYVTLGRGNALAEVDPYAPGILRTLALEGEPHGLAVDGDRLYVTLDHADTLITLDRASLTEVARTPTGSTPHTVAVSGGVAYVTDSRDNRVRAIPGDVLAETGETPESVAIVGAFVATADNGSGTVSVFARDGLRLLRRVEVGSRPVRVMALPNGRLAVSLNNGARIAVIDPATGKTERRPATPGHPDGMCLSPSGEYVAVASNELDVIELFRVRDWAGAGSLDAGDGPGACVWISPR
jgi:YVTN family beta-propeller protein